MATARAVRYSESLIIRCPSQPTSRVVKAFEANQAGKEGGKLGYRLQVLFLSPKCRPVHDLATEAISGSGTRAQELKGCVQIARDPSPGQLDLGIANIEQRI